MRLGFTPDVGRWSGLHEPYDGKVADYSAAGIRARIAKLEEGRRELATLKARDDEDSLDIALLQWDFAEQLFWLTERSSWTTDPAFYEELFSLNVYIDRPYLPLSTRLEALVAHEEKALQQVPHVRENLKPPLAKPLVDVAILIYRGYADYLRTDVAAVVAKAELPQLKARFEKSNTALADAAAALADWLKTVPTDESSHVLGAEKFQHLVDIYAGQHIPLQEFQKTGEDALARDQKVHDALAKTVTPTRPPAADLIKTAGFLTEGARRFILEHHIVTLASEERAQVIETPPYKRYNAAWLDTGGAYDPPLGAFFYVTPPDPTWPQERQTEYIPRYGELRATSTHEVYPGHFVQYGWLRRAPTKTQKIIGSSTFIEGWAHYGEQMMAEEGFSADPENHLGQVDEALLRDCRYLVALGVHTQGMTIAQAENRFVEDCHQTSAVAKEQSLRAAFHPWYFAYTLGKLQILALREEAKRAPKYTLQRFHDALLAHGQGPVGLIRPRVLRDLGLSSP